MNGDFISWKGECWKRNEFLGNQKYCFVSANWNADYIFKCRCRVRSLTCESGAQRRGWHGSVNLGVLRLEEFHGEYMHEEKIRDLGPGAFQSLQVRSRSWIQPRRLSRGIQWCRNKTRGKWFLETTDGSVSGRKEETTVSFIAISWSWIIRFAKWR